MILVIDNYDSFTYNLVQYLGELGAELKVYRNDKITLEEIKKMAATYIQRIPDSDPALKTRHPFLGWLNTAEWIQLCNIHFRHHLRQKSRLQKHLGLK